MVDTVRTTAELLTLFADNTTGEISPQDLRDFVVSAGVYGSLYITGGSTAQTGIGTTATKVTAFTASGDSANVTVSVADDRITLDNEGVYQINFAGSFSGSQNTVFTFEFQVGDVAITNAKAARKIGSGGDIGSTALTDFYTASAGDQLTVAVKADDTGKQITMQEATLSVVRVS